MTSRYPGTPDGFCGAVESVSSHGGGTDYSAPCKQPVNKKGKHKGSHETQKGHRWPNADAR